ncbi:hypothetical protein HD554DRAFT_2177381 [Boletus coccyginus]|nr:hypothetical protein HD554DRAFT_2177381 [Boletus coccyginus]
MTKELATFLRKLWDQIVFLIVASGPPNHWNHAFGGVPPPGSILPLHAAGLYRKGELNLPHLYPSSYTPTLTPLIRARRRNPSDSATEHECFIAVGQANAAGGRKPLSVGAELGNTSQRVDGLTTFTHIVGEESYISEVVEEVGKNEWVHLACHGLPNRKQPFESAFALLDGHFAIQQTIGCDLKNSEFAYLSACHTTFIGFHSVIGTMWTVDDGETNKITSTFYKHMVDESGRLDHTRETFALNKTMKSVDIPFWYACISLFAFLLCIAHTTYWVRFYAKEWKLYMDLDIPNHKESPEIISEVKEATGVLARALMTLQPGLDDVRQKLCLAPRQRTTLLLVVYGEGDQVLGRLLAQLLTSSGDTNILAWTGKSGSFNNCLLTNITVFKQSPPSYSLPACHRKHLDG